MTHIHPGLCGAYSGTGELNRKQAVVCRPADAELRPMFFFIGGIQPKTRVIDNVARRCPNCGLHQAFLQQVDHYLSLFFIPLVRVRKGTPFLYCRRCQQAVSEGGDGRPAASQTTVAMQCSRCGRLMDREFSYCPFCGQKL